MFRVRVSRASRPYCIFTTYLWSMRNTSALHVGHSHHPLGWEVLYRSFCASAYVSIAASHDMAALVAVVALPNSIGVAAELLFPAFSKALLRHGCNIAPQLKQYQLLLHSSREPF